METPTEVRQHNRSINMSSFLLYHITLTVTQTTPKRKTPTIENVKHQPSDSNQVFFFNWSPIQAHVRYNTKLDKKKKISLLKKKKKPDIPILDPTDSNGGFFIAIVFWYQSCRSGRAITRPKMERSKKIIQVGNDCFLSFLLSTTPFTSFANPVESIALSNKGPEFAGWDVFSGTGSGACCSSLYLSTYSGNIFRNVAL